MAENKIKTIGVLTSGGDAPGMNAAIRGVSNFTNGEVSPSNSIVSLVFTVERDFQDIAIFHI